MPLPRWTLLRAGAGLALAWDEAPFLPLGEYKQPTAYCTSSTGVLDGTAVFWNVRPA